VGGELHPLNLDTHTNRIQPLRERTMRPQLLLLLMAGLWACNTVPTENAPEFAKGGPAPTPPPANPAIAYRLLNANKPDNVMVMNVDGTNQAAVFTGLTFTGPDWSPDGRSLVFGGSVNGIDGVYAVGVSVVGGRAVGSSPRLLQSDYQWGDPQWSPDGTLIAVAGVEVSPGVTGIVTFPAAGGDATVLYSATPPRRTQWPTWSPDQTHIAFTEIDDQAATSTLKILDLGTGQTTDLLTLPPALIRYPEWSHDGTRIAYSRHNGDGKENLYTIAVAGGADPVLIGRGYAPSWSPQDDRLLYNIDARSTSVAVIPIAGGTSAVLVKDGLTPDWH
jgi:Tol biopolymer transport system component